MASSAYLPVCSINVAEDVTHVQKTKTGKVLKENRGLELYPSKLYTNTVLVNRK